MRKPVEILLCLLSIVFILTGCDNSQRSSSNPAEGMQIATLSVKPALATAVPTASNAPTMVPTPTQDFGPFILMLDDFSNPGSGWEVSENDYGRTAYEQGGYLVEAFIEEEYYWGVAGVDYADIRIDVDVSVLSTSTIKNDAFGVDCRVQENGDGYGFRISSDGYVSISEYIDTKGYKLVDWFESEAVYTDGRVNSLTAICQGDHLQFLVNGENVAEVVDDTFTIGDIALSAASLEVEPITVLFDDLVVQELGNPYDYEDASSS